MAFASCSQLVPWPSLCIGYSLFRMQILRISARICGVGHPELSAIPADGRDVMVRLFIDATEPPTPLHPMGTPLSLILE